MKAHLMNKVDIFNEATILMLCYIVWQFSDHNPDLSLKMQLGWIYVAVLFGNLAFNVFLLIYISFL